MVIKKRKLTDEPFKISNKGSGVSNKPGSSNKSNADTKKATPASSSTGGSKPASEFQSSTSSSSGISLAQGSPQVQKKPEGKSGISVPKAEKTTGNEAKSGAEATNKSENKVKVSKSDSGGSESTKSLATSSGDNQNLYFLCILFMGLNNIQFDFKVLQSTKKSSLSADNSLTSKQVKSDAKPSAPSSSATVTANQKSSVKDNSKFSPKPSASKPAESAIAQCAGTGKPSHQNKQPKAADVDQQSSVKGTLSSSSSSSIGAGFDDEPLTLSTIIKTESKNMQNNLKKKKQQSKCVPNEADEREVEQAFKNIFEATYNKSAEPLATDTEPPKPSGFEKVLSQVEEALEEEGLDEGNDATAGVDVTLTCVDILEVKEDEIGIKAKLDEIVDTVTAKEVDEVEIKSIIDEIKDENGVEGLQQGLLDEVSEKNSRMDLIESDNGKEIKFETSCAIESEHVEEEVCKIEQEPEAKEETAQMEVQADTVNECDDIAETTAPDIISGRLLEETQESQTLSSSDSAEINATSVLTETAEPSSIDLNDGTCEAASVLLNLGLEKNIFQSPYLSSPSRKKHRSKGSTSSNDSMNEFKSIPTGSMLPHISADLSKIEASFPLFSSQIKPSTVKQQEQESSLVKLDVNVNNEVDSVVSKSDINFTSPTMAVLQEHSVQQDDLVFNPNKMDLNAAMSLALSLNNLSNNNFTPTETSINSCIQPLATAAENKEDLILPDSNLSKMDVAADVCEKRSSTDSEPALAISTQETTYLVPSIIPLHSDETNFQTKETNGIFNPPVVAVASAETPLVESEIISNDISRSTPILSSTKKSEIMDFTSRSKNLGKFFVFSLEFLFSYILIIMFSF